MHFKFFSFSPFLDFCTVMFTVVFIEARATLLTLSCPVGLLKAATPLADFGLWGGWLRSFRLREVAYAVSKLYELCLAAVATELQENLLTKPLSSRNSMLSRWRKRGHSQRPLDSSDLYDVYKLYK